MQAKSAPVSPKPSSSGSRSALAATRDHRPIRSTIAAFPRDARYVKPELVAEVRFTEWTDAGRIRHPAYLGLRSRQVREGDRSRVNAKRPHVAPNRRPRVRSGGVAVVAALMLVAPNASRRRARCAVPVPAKYKTMYTQTAADLKAYAKTIRAMPNYTKKPAGPRVGFVELLAANGHRQTDLLKPSAMTLVNRSLDVFKRLGVGGVVLGVKLPLLLPQYTPQAEQYAEFFAKVARRGARAGPQGRRRARRAVLRERVRAGLLVSVRHDGGRVRAAHGAAGAHRHRQGPSRLSQSDLRARHRSDPHRTSPSWRRSPGSARSYRRP